jgi:hypothetical protein
LKAERERQRREECNRAVSNAYQKSRDAVCQNADVLAGFGVAGLAGLGLVVLMRRSEAT